MANRRSTLLILVASCVAVTLSRMMGSKVETSRVSHALTMSAPSTTAAERGRVWNKGTLLCESACEPCKHF